MKLLITTVATLIFISCSDGNKTVDLSGTYRNIDDFSETRIERVSDSLYKIISPDGKFTIEASLKDNILTGAFQGATITTEFNATHDTIFNKANGKLMFTCVKVVK